MDNASLSALGAPAAGVVEPAKPRLKARPRCTNCLWKCWGCWIRPVWWTWGR